MNIHVECERHSTPQFRFETNDEWTFSHFCTKAIVGGEIGLDFTVNLLNVVKIIGKGCMDFREIQVRVLSGDFVRRPAVKQMRQNEL